MKNLIVNGVKFYPIDKDNEIEIEREGWSFWLTIEETKKVIDFLTKQVEEPKQFVECKCTNSLQAENCIRNCGHGKEPKQETHICKYCNAETTQSDDECYAKPKTLDEAAENYAEGKSSSSVFQEAHKKDFINGAKWQQERMYSEEDVRTAIFKSFLLGYDKVYSNELEDIIIEQFKKEEKQ